MTYKLELKISPANSINTKKVTKKFENLHALAEFLVNIAPEVYIKYNSGEDRESEYWVSNGNHDGSNDCARYYTLLGDKKIIDFCMEKFDDLITINNKTGNYFNSKDIPDWRGGHYELEEENYKKASQYLARQNKLFAAQTKQL